MRTKDAAVQLKAGPDDGLAEGEFTAYASVFGNKDSYDEVVMPGAFSNTLNAWTASGAPIPLLFGHNMSDPDFNIGHVVEASEDGRGLKVRAQLDLQNPKAAQVYRMLKGRRVNQMSFAYDVLSRSIEERARVDGDGFEMEPERYVALHELKLYEVSVVTIGANQETEILEVKQVPTFADRTLADLKAGRVLSAKNEGEIRTAHDALSRVLAVLDADDTDEEKASGKPGKSVRPDAQGPAVAPVNPSVSASAVLDAFALEIKLSA
ncbi:HK97 family phage prohead protease [Nocardia sp. CNY236]|uniref:HK97 family phage prohead protease n=1 Tax=Nocardia sp. CNY236 TaxID=1169152 RepID=UPI00048E3CC2|nr:HK97 family phage prohead protease [Nocardia sp. CNY236]